MATATNGNGGGAGVNQADPLAVAKAMVQTLLGKVSPAFPVSLSGQELSDALTAIANNLDLGMQGRANLSQMVQTGMAQLQQCQAALQKAQGQLSKAPVTSNGQPLKPGMYVSAPAVAAVAGGAALIAGIATYAIVSSKSKKAHAAGELGTGAKNNPLPAKGFSSLEWETYDDGVMEAEGTKAVYIIAPAKAVGKFELMGTRFSDNRGMRLGVFNSPMDAIKRAVQYEQTGK